MVDVHLVDEVVGDVWNLLIGLPGSFTTSLSPEGTVPHAVVLPHPAFRRSVTHRLLITSRTPPVVCTSLRSRTALLRGTINRSPILPRVHRSRFRR